MGVTASSCIIKLNPYMDEDACLIYTYMYLCLPFHNYNVIQVYVICKVCQATVNILSVSSVIDMGHYTARLRKEGIVTTELQRIISRM